MHLIQKYIHTILLILCVLIPSLIFAQPVFDDSVSDVPVDGGLSLLIAGGIGYAANEFKKIKSKK